MADVMEAAEPAEVTNTETAVLPYPVEAPMEAVSAMMAAMSAMMAAVSAASRCDRRRESNDRGSDGKGDGLFRNIDLSHPEAIHRMRCYCRWLKPS
jgi:hypothetical protein